LVILFVKFAGVMNLNYDHIVIKFLGELNNQEYKSIKKLNLALLGAGLCS
jgi:hypothetical protein